MGSQIIYMIKEIENNFQIISWLGDFAGKFTYNPNYAQFALLQFSDVKVNTSIDTLHFFITLQVGTPIILNGAENLKEFRNRLQNTPYVNSFANIFDVNGVISELNSTFLRNAQGFRGGSTTVIFVSSSSRWDIFSVFL